MLQVTVRVAKPDSSGLAFGKRKYYASVLENSTKTDIKAILTVLGSEVNEDIRYTILNPTKYFVVGETSGVVRTTGLPFDREAADRHEVLVQAWSPSGGRVAHAIVDVEVIDVNDNAPSFVNVPYYAVMARGSPKGRHK